LCAANCGADEYGSACLSAQREIGTCFQTQRCIGCGMSHGSVYVGGAPGVSNAGNAGASTASADAGDSAVLAEDGANSVAGAAGSEPVDVARQP